MYTSPNCAQSPKDIPDSNEYKYPCSALDEECFLSILRLLAIIQLYHQIPPFANSNLSIGYLSSRLNPPVTMPSNTPIIHHSGTSTRGTSPSGSSTYSSGGSVSSYSSYTPGSYREYDAGMPSRPEPSIDSLESSLTWPTASFSSSVVYSGSNTLVQHGKTNHEHNAPSPNNYGGGYTRSG
jgi:hypothetical protein